MINDIWNTPAEIIRLAVQRNEARAEVEQLRAEVNNACFLRTTVLALTIEVTQLREQVATLTALWRQAIDADLLDDPHELEAAIVKAAALLDYPRRLDDD